MANYELYLPPERKSYGLMRSLSSDFHTPFSSWLKAIAHHDGGDVMVNPPFKDIESIWHTEN